MRNYLFLLFLTVLSVFSINAMEMANVGLVSNPKFPSTGEHRALVVLVEFQNRKFSVRWPQEYYSRMLNSDSFNDYGNSTSVRKYYEENSNGLFKPQFDIVGPVTLPNDYAYYGENVIRHNDIVGDYIDDIHPELMIVDACNLLASAGFDFSPYDCNGDGEIDNIFLYYAGFGEADSGIISTVWPHSGNLLEKGFADSPLYFNDLILNHYACSNELKAETGQPDGIGTFIHEFTHVMGFPDLYPMSTNSVITPDNWDVMDIGCYLNQGKTPPNFSAFELYALGWLNPEEISEYGEYELPCLHSSDRKAYIIYSKDNRNEFFILENRQQRGNDINIPGHGMLVWHIDFNQEIWDANLVNSDSGHPCVSIVEADNLTGHYEILEEKGKLPQLVYNYENEGDAFPGTTNNTSFTPYTAPAFLDYNKNSTGFGLINIKESEDGLITFFVTDGENNRVGDIQNDVASLIINDNEVSLRNGESEVFDIAGRLVCRLSAIPVVLPKGVYFLSNGKKFMLK